MEQKFPITLLDDEGNLSPMLQSMKEVRDTMPVYDIRLVNEFPLLTSFVQPLFIGSFAWTAMFERWKMIKRNYSLEVYDHVLTPADVARDYIRAKYKKPGRITSRQYENCVKVHRQAPLMARPCEVENAVYLDLKSAYWSILQVVGWDVDYSPGRFLGVNSTCQDFPLWRHKMARNCLVSTGLVGWGKRWNGEKLEFVKKSNPLTNMVLWALVQDVLNSVAAEMVDAGAVYVHTDGYIFPHELMERGLTILAEWGLIGSVRHQGKCKVYAVGTYEVGEHKVKRAVHGTGQYFDNINRDALDWLKPRFSHFARKTRLILA